MTDIPNPDDLQPENRQQSLSLPLDDKDLLRWRVLPVELARLLGVSKQSVSRWISDGKIPQPSPLDGRMDLQRALRDVLRNTDPGRLRSRVLRQAVEDVTGLRDNLARAEDRAETAEAALQTARARIAYLEAFSADLDCMLERVLQLVVESEIALRATPDADAWREMVDRIEVAAAEACGGDDSLDALDALTAREAHAPEGGGGD